MSRDIDLTQGGYGGDIVEEGFKWFTSEHMEYWWHFREVLRPSLNKRDTRWLRTDGKSLTDDDYRTFIAIGMLNYAVYVGIAESFSFFDELKVAVAQNNLFVVRRNWKSLYSSLYSAFNAVCNLACVVIFNKSPFGDDPTKVWNWTPSKSITLANGQGKLQIRDNLTRCQTRLEIRDHLDHYWTIWINLGVNRFFMDRNFAKGYIALEPDVDVDSSVDAKQRAIDDIVGCAQDFNLIYKEMAVSGGYFDQYLAAKNWSVSYDDYGFPHNHQRPKP